MSVNVLGWIILAGVVALLVFTMLAKEDSDGRR